MHYGIKPFKDEVLCDVSPLEVCNVFLGQPYMWKRHVFYESRPCSVIITFGDQIYKVLEVVQNIVVSLISMKQCRKVVSHIRRFFLYMVLSKGDQNVTTTAKTSAWGLSTQQQRVDRIVDKYKDIFASPTRVPMHCQAKHPIDVTPSAPQCNGPVYMIFVMDNEEIKRCIQEPIVKGHIITRSSPCERLIFLVQKKDGTW
jgi:hypothetical protein